MWEAEYELLPVRPWAIEQTVEIVAVDRRQMHVGVRRGQAELALADRLRALPDDRPGHARLSLERVERRVVDIDDALAGRRNGVCRRHGGGQRGRDGGEPEEVELRLLQEVGEARPRRGTASPKGHEA